MAKEVIEKKDVWEREELLTGCQAVSHGVRLADVDVIGAYPIRPLHRGDGHALEAHRGW